MIPTYAQETAHAAMGFQQEGSGLGVSNGTVVSSAPGTSQIRNLRSGVRKRCPGPSGEGLVPEPWWMIFLPGSSRFKRRRKGAAEGLTQPTSLSVKSQWSGDAKRNQGCPEGPRRSAATAERHHWSLGR